MSDASSTPERFAESDFSVGRVINRSTSVLSRNFPIYFIIAMVAYLPTLTSLIATAPLYGSVTLCGVDVAAGVSPPWNAYLPQL